tara:strand:- start:58 stop:444 length:387 start_codon:yes stop_codon:yes gene_type:complete
MYTEIEVNKIKSTGSTIIEGLKKGSNNATLHQVLGNDGYLNDRWKGKTSFNVDGQQVNVKVNKINTKTIEVSYKTIEVLEYLGSRFKAAISTTGNEYIANVVLNFDVVEIFADGKSLGTYDVFIPVIR